MRARQPAPATDPARRRVLAGGLLVGLGALVNGIGGRAAVAQPKPIVTVHKSPT